MDFDDIEKMLTNDETTPVTALMGCVLCIREVAVEARIHSAKADADAAMRIMIEGMDTIKIMAGSLLETLESAKELEEKEKKKRKLCDD